MLSGQIDAKDITQDPLPEVLDSFYAYCTTVDQLYQFHSPHSRQLVPPTLIKIGTAAALKQGGKLAGQIHFVERHMLEYMHTYLARFGLLRWCPDLRQSPYALYNAACRIVAVDTFKKAIISHTYNHVHPNRRYLDDMDLLLKIYDHIVFYANLKCYKTELRNPGAVRSADEASPAYHGRQQVCSFFFSIEFF